MVDSEKFTQSWSAYLSNLAGARSHVAIEAIFLDFVRQTFGIPLSDYRLEERVYQGRIDALLGNLVLEFKRDLVKERIDAEEELKRYISQLREKHSAASFTGVATDGARFRVYNSALEILAEKDLRRAKPEDALLFLDSLFFIFRSSQIPTAANIVAVLGPKSPTFLSSQAALHSLFDTVREEPAVQVRFREWQKYLQRVYGEAVGDEALFLKHTYLATLAKFIAFFFRSGSALPSSEDVEEVVKGVKFSRQGISNFIEDDFFTWPLNEKAKARGLPLVQKLVASLMAYEFSAANQDILKELYEEILGQEARHNLGEYYTPDWLAEYMLRELVHLPENPDWRVLDPACGSGTFLFTAIRLLRASLENLGHSRLEVLRKIQSQVVGMDVHPVAVTIARTNYLLALSDLINPLPEPISLPVYLADSLRPPAVSKVFEKGTGEAFYEVVAETNTIFSVPETLGPYLDRTVEIMRTFLGHPKEQALTGFQGEVAKLPISPEAREAVNQDFRTLLELYHQGKDTVWLFILKNMPRPRFMQGDFDLVMGNPPWLSLRYIQDARYKSQVKNLILNTYHLLSRKKTHLFTHLDLAPLFFVQASFLYLKKGGHIAFVMPRGVLSADQYAEFTSFEFLGEYPISFALEHVVDLAPVPREREVTPLFLQAACVIVAQKDGETAFPVPATQMEGQLKGKNLRWAEAQKQLKLTPVRLSRVQGKLLTQKEAREPTGKSYYHDKVFQGATLVPCNFFFVRAAREAGPATRPVLETDEEEARQAKEPWRSLRMRGAVEGRFIFATLLGGDIVPFGHRPLRPVLLPLTEESDKALLVNYSQAVEQGYTGLAAWLREVEGHWQHYATKDERGQTKIANVLEQIDYRRKLTSQRLNSGYKVLYNKSGTHIAACVLDISTLSPVELGGGLSLPVSGFVADHVTYYFETARIEEACYLAAVLNSWKLDHDIKSDQSRGLLGERDIHKKPFLKKPIPRYDASQSSHRRLAELGQECHQKVTEVLPSLLPRYKGSGPLRTRLRELLQDNLKTIDWHVRRLL